MAEKFRHKFLHRTRMVSSSLSTSTYIERFSQLGKCQTWDLFKCFILADLRVLYENFGQAIHVVQANDENLNLELKHSVEIDELVCAEMKTLWMVIFSQTRAKNLNYHFEFIFIRRSFFIFQFIKILLDLTKNDFP